MPGDLCKIFGRGLKQMSSDELPSISEVMRHFFYVQNNLKGSFDTESRARNKVAENLKTIWKNHDIPILSDSRVQSILKKFWNDRKIVLKSVNSKYFNDKRISIREKFNVLLDISLDKTNQENKLSPKALNYLNHQRNPRPLFKKPSQNTQIVIPQTRNLVKNETEIVVMDVDEEIDLNIDEDLDKRSQEVESESESETIQEKNVKEDDADYVPSNLNVQKLHLPTASAIADRYNISDRALAAITSGVLVDVGMIEENNKEFVIDRSKVRRERIALRKVNIENHDCECGEALFFDGKIDKSIKILIDKNVPVKEDHIVLVREPDSEYVGHISPISGSAADITDAILEFFNNNLAKLLAVGTDGTVVNTGHRGGIIRLLEQEIDRPVQWLICLLHLNELPLRAYFKYLDGDTSGPKNYEGPIGKAIGDCEKYPPVKFVPIISALSKGKL